MTDKKPTAAAKELGDEQLLRYSRQIMLPRVDVAGQQALLNARVLIIGLGGLGAPAAMYLAAAGVGHLVLVDHDKVDLSNLQRQIVHTTDNIGRTKTASAAQLLGRLNPEIRLTTIDRKLERQALEEQTRLADVVLDASDNFPTRFLLNEVCVQQRTPLVSGAVIRLEGQVSVFRPGGPCYRCLYSDTEAETETCSETGVLAPLPGIIGSIQATETLKILLNLGESLSGRLLLLDAATMEWRSIGLKKDPACPVCGPG